MSYFHCNFASVCLVTRIIICYLLACRWYGRTWIFSSGFVIPSWTKLHFKGIGRHQEGYRPVNSKIIFHARFTKRNYISLRSTSDNNLKPDYKKDDKKPRRYFSPQNKQQRTALQSELQQVPHDANLTVLFDELYNEPLILNNHIRSEKEILLSYAYSIQRVRKRMVKKYIQLRDDYRFVLHENELNMLPKEDYIKPSRSLLGYLSNGRVSYESDNDLTDLVHVLNRAVVQAIRSATSVNDYKLVMQLVVAVRTYAKPLSNKISIGPRIIGEAVCGLLKTSVNIGKIRSLWNTSFHTSGGSGMMYLDPSVYGSPTAKEINAMLQAYIHHKKIRAAINFFHEHDDIVDSYSISTILNALTESIKMKRSERPSGNIEFNQGSNLEPKKMTQSGLPTLSDDFFLPWLSSTVWQWNEAIRLIDTGLLRHKNDSIQLVNNPVMSSLLKLNKRIAEEVGTKHHDGPVYAVRILQLMREINISPDEMTYTTVIANLGSRWKMALKLLRCSQQQNHQGLFDDSIPDTRHRHWILPKPNNHVYSATIAVCAASKQYDVATQLLNEVYTQHYKDHSVQPTSWMYNSVLQALVSRDSWEKNENRLKRAKTAKRRLRLMFSVLNRMDKCVLPTVQVDTVTFNTVLSVFVHASKYLEDDDWSFLYTMWCACIASNTNLALSDEMSWKERLLDSIISRMVERNVARDFTTYRHAFKFLNGNDADSILRLLARSISEVNIKNKVYENDARNTIINLYHECLYCMVSSGDTSGAMTVISEIPFEGPNVPSSIISQMVETLKNGKKTSEIPLFLLAASGDTEAIKIFSDRNGAEMDLRLVGCSDTINRHQYSKAISLCLSNDDFTSAHRVLILMQQTGNRPSDSTYEEIALKYASIALIKFPCHTGRTQTDSSVDFPVIDDRSNSIIAAQSSASRAYNIIYNLAIKDSATTIGIVEVAKVCGLVELWQESRQLLGLIHSRLSLNAAEITTALIDLHRVLLSVCANTGNLTHALLLCEDIQSLSTKLKRHTTRSESIEVASMQSDNNFVSRYNDVSLAMKADEWKSVLVAAAKSSNWHVCLTTLQCLRPFIEETHPYKAANAARRIQLAHQYSSLEFCLSTSVKCLGAYGHYAWIIRIIDDWIEWSGRRPPREAILAAIRSLSSRGRGAEASSLLLRCVEMPPTASKLSEHIENYLLFVGAITAFHRGGLYDAADGAFAAAISHGVLQLNVNREFNDGSNRIVLDLHGMNVAVARAAVRISLQQEFLTNRDPDFPSSGDVIFMIVTGRGLNSVIRMRPVLRPEVQRMLLEEFYPPLSTMSVPGNMGALVLSSNDITLWLEHQKNQRGVRLLAVASIIQSYGDRIRIALSSADSYFQ